MANNVADMNAVLTVCGFTNQNQRDTIIDEGFASLDDFSILTSDEVSEMAKRITSMRQNQGAFVFGAIRIKKLQALVHWVKDTKVRGLPLDPANFTPDIMNEHIKLMAIGVTESDETEVKAPSSFESKKWVQWKLLFTNYVKSLKGCENVPLNYIIRSDDPTVVAAGLANPETALIFQASLQGPPFRKDNKRVYAIMKQLLVDTVAWAWIQRYDRTENGREAMTALSNHYDGPGQVTKRLSEARSDIKSLHYKGIESSFPFETYITRLQDNFETLRLNGEEEHESNQVRILLDGIDSSNSQLNAAKVNIGMSQTLRNDFTGACNVLAKQISLIFHKDRKRQGRRIASAQRGRGRGRGHGGRGGRGKYFVDINNQDDLLKSYPPNVFAKFPKHIKAKITEAKKSQKGGENDNRKLSALTVSELNDSITRGVQAARREDMSIITEDNTSNQGAQFGGSGRSKRSLYSKYDESNKKQKDS